MWRVINTLTKDHSTINSNLSPELTPDVFDAHFIFVVSNVLPDGSQYSCLNKLLSFCHEKKLIKITHFLHLNYLCLEYEKLKAVSKTDNKKSTG